MAEWLKAHAWKACKGETLSWVRIPFSPPLNNALNLSSICQLNEQLKIIIKHFSSKSDIIFFSKNLKHEE